MNEGGRSKKSADDWGCAVSIALMAWAIAMTPILLIWPDPPSIVFLAGFVVVPVVTFFVALSWIRGGGNGAVSPASTEKEITAPVRKVISRGGQYQKYLQSPEWQSTRKQAIARAGYRCQLCGAYASCLEVHHNTYENLGNAHPTDIIVLCHDCHSRFHAGGRMPTPH